MLHSSDSDPDNLRRLLADRIAQDQARGFRRYFVTRLTLLAAAVWLLSWPIHLLPHTLLWALLATMALAIGLMSPSQHPSATRRTTQKPRR